MNRSVSFSLLGIGGVVLLAVVGWNMLIGPANKVRKGKRGSAKTGVAFILDENNDCVVSEGVGTLGASGAKKHPIAWLVTNYCPAPMYVAITHYQPYQDADDPSSTLGSVDNTVVKYPRNQEHYDSKPIAANGANEVTIDNLLDKNASGTHTAHKYWICVSDKIFTAFDPPASSGKMKCLDPDVDVWP